MIEDSERAGILAAVPLLTTLPSDLLDEFMHEASLSRVPAGRDLIAEGERIDSVPLVVSGRIRVYRIGETGREITVYRFGQGECCVLSADSILGGRQFPANAQTEDDVEVAFIPAMVFDRWLARSPEWRTFIFEAMSRRLVSLLDTVDDVAFRRLDVRIAELLLQRAGTDKKTVHVTHQAIADELGSSREVISRVLEDLQSRGLIRLSRGTVEITDPEALGRAAAV